MNKITSIIFMTLLITGIVFSQTYPTRSIYEIQYRPDDSLAGGKDKSPYLGDTVRVVGRVMANTLTSDRKPIMWAGARWQTYLTDTAGGNAWAGLNIIQDDSVTQLTLMDLVDTTHIVAITGVISEFGTTYGQTQLNVLRTIPVEFIGSQTSRPAPVEIELSQLANGTGINLVGGEKYEGMYVIIRNVITSNANSTSGTFNINDALGNSIAMHDQSGYFTKRAHKLVNYEPPTNGTMLSYIRGVIGTGSAGYVIRPMYPGDIQIGSVVPPIISSIQRDKPVVAPNTAVQVQAKITDLDGTIASAKLIYKVNNGAFQELNMSKISGDTIWAATIPGVLDSSLVSYFITATDNGNNTVINPTDTSRSRYFYLVLNRPLSVSDVQYAPWANGLGGYVNYRVTVSGVVTADTSDLRGDGGSVSRRVYIQSTAGPWAGIWLRGTQADNLYRGYNVTVSGKLVESNSHTCIDSITSVTINSQNQPLPPAIKTKTGDIGGKSKGTITAEMWEGVLIYFDSVSVTSENADGNPGPNGGGNSNFGEILINDGTGNIRVELQEGPNSYHNFWSAVPPADKTIALKVGDTFSSMKGVLFYSFSNYKLVPRKNDDFVGYTPVSVDDKITPKGFYLSQNYPNPFNPGTTIEYNITKTANVSLKVYDLLGNEVVSLVNSENQKPGLYRYYFNGSNLASGIYFYTLISDNVVNTRKMILIK